MNLRFNRPRTGLAVVLCAIAVLAVLAVPALGAHATRKPAAAHSQSAIGDFVAGGTFNVHFTAARAAGAAPTAATGQFSAVMALGSTPIMSVSGPITCLEVVGNRVGLFYPVTSSSPALEAQLHIGVLFYAQLGADGKPQSANFIPVPTQKVSSCTPLPGLIPITSGTLTLGS